MNMTTKMIASAIASATAGTTIVAMMITTVAMTIIAIMIATAAMTIIVLIIKYEKTNDVCIDAYHQLWCISSEKNGNR
jgi:hypothetical protein